MKNILTQKLISLLGLMTCSTIALYSPVPISIFFIIVLFTLTIIILIKKKTILLNKWVFLFFLYALLNLFLKSNEIEVSFRQYTQLLISFFTFYFLFFILSKETFISIYLKFSLFISLIAITQEIGYLLNIPFLYDFTNFFGMAEKKSYALNLLRVTALFSEPAHLGFFLLIPMYLLYKDKNFIKYFPIPLAFLLTFSFGNYLMLMLLLILASLVLNKKTDPSKIFILLALSIIILICIYTIPEVNQKFNSLFIDEDNMRNSENGSMFAIYSLLIANIDAWLNNIFFGAGFGNSISIYNQYMYNQFNVIMHKNAVYPDELFLAKILGELGLIGILFLFLAIKSKWKNNTDLGRACLLAFFIISLKSGSYYNPMLFLLLSFYLTSSSFYEKNQKNNIRS